MGHVNGLMCSRASPKLVIKLNDKVVMPNKWDSDGFGASKYSIQPPCKPRDGSNGRDDSTYDGREIDYNYPSGAKDYGTCSFAQKTLPCHRSPDFDTGDLTLWDDSKKTLYKEMEGIVAWNKGVDQMNQFTMQLECGSNVVVAAGLVIQNCDHEALQKHWIGVVVPASKTEKTRKLKKKKTKLKKKKTKRKDKSKDKDNREEKASKSAKESGKEARSKGQELASWGDDGDDY
eukprot:g3820.t1